MTQPSLTLLRSPLSIIITKQTKQKKTNDGPRTLLQQGVVILYVLAVSNCRLDGFERNEIDEKISSLYSCLYSSLYSIS
jgi:hypothetical protein